jgi:hypothetical protein
VNIKGIKELSIDDSLNIECQSDEGYYNLIHENEVSSEKIIATMYYNYIKPYGGFLLLVPITLIYITFTVIELVSLFRLIWCIDAINAVRNSFKISKGIIFLCL